MNQHTENESHTSSGSWIVVDYGGVLTNPIEETVSLFCQHHGLSPNSLLTAMRAAGEGDETGMALLEKAAISEKEFLSRVNSQLFPLGELEITQEVFHDTWFQGRTANIPMLKALKTLHSQGVRLALLTNNVVEWREQWHRTLGQYRTIFDVVIDSSEVGVRKPEKEIFEILLQSTALSASSSLFIDDDAANIAAGQSFGLNCHLFTETAEALKALDEFVSNNASIRKEVISPTPQEIQ